jgi:hypothetical protein
MSVSDVPNIYCTSLLHLHNSQCHSCCHLQYHNCCLNCQLNQSFQLSSTDAGTSLSLIPPSRSQFFCISTLYEHSLVKVKVILQLTISHSVSLGIEHPPGAHDQIFIAPQLLRSCFCGEPSLTRGWVCLLYMLLALASAVFLGS